MTHDFEAVHEATRRLVRRVDELSDQEFREPSLLPGWSRAHVVAHLTLNAQALAGVLQGLAAGVETPMYSSPQGRDADIEQLAPAAAPVLRDRFLASCTIFQEAALHTPDEAWSGSFPRTPGADPWPAAEILGMRLREVEIHHADLAAGYGPADWSPGFVDAVLARVVADRAAGPAVRLRTPDGDVLLGDGDGPVVTGSRRDLAWWLLGRGSGDGLTGDPEVPRLGPWR